VRRSARRHGEEEKDEEEEDTIIDLSDENSGGVEPLVFVRNNQPASSSSSSSSSRVVKLVVGPPPLQNAVVSRPSSHRDAPESPSSPFSSSSHPGLSEFFRQGYAARNTPRQYSVVHSKRDPPAPLHVHSRLDSANTAAASADGEEEEVWLSTRSLRSAAAVPLLSLQQQQQQQQLPPPQSRRTPHQLPPPHLTTTTTTRVVVSRLNSAPPVAAAPLPTPASDSEEEPSLRLQLSAALEAGRIQQAAELAEALGDDEMATTLWLQLTEDVAPPASNQPQRQSSPPPFPPPSSLPPFPPSFIPPFVPSASQVRPAPLSYPPSPPHQHPGILARPAVGGSYGNPPPLPNYPPPSPPPLPAYPPPAIPRSPVTAPSAPPFESGRRDYRYPANSPAERGGSNGHERSRNFSSTSILPVPFYSSEASRMTEEVPACKLCFETLFDDRFLHPVTRTCNHKYCVSCILTYLETQLKIKSDGIRCPGCAVSSSSAKSAAVSENAYILESAVGLIDPEVIFDIFAHDPKEPPLPVNSTMFGLAIPPESKVALTIERLMRSRQLLHFVYPSSSSADAKTSSKVQCTKCNIWTDADPVRKCARCSNPFCAILFCSECKQKVHAGKTCEQVIGAVTAINGRSDENYIRTTGVQCPKCSRYIQHFHGHHCHHMECPCGKEFCFPCQRDYHDIVSSSNQDHTCSVFCTPYEQDFDTGKYHKSTKPNACSCLPCDLCKVNEPCDLCSGDCIVCLGKVPPGNYHLGAALAD